ncbi:MAG TPA: hypothetical protein DIW23_07210 [Anaerolineae bacterium]|nr:hypothetical protein [Anaerolineae bacterium]
MSKNNPLEKAIRSSVKMNETIGTLFRETGTIQEGKGFVVTVYKNANRALPQALKETNVRFAVRDIVSELKQTLNSNLRSVLNDSIDSGIEESARQLRFYNIQTNTKNIPKDLSKQVDTALEVIMAQVDSQASAIQAALITDAVDNTIITGDEDRQGILRPSDILSVATFWIAALIWDSFSYWALQNQGGTRFSKQAIAGLDARTTDCCLRVHGQVQDLKGKFKLTGTPRFSDYLSWSPFHWYCRTAITLYLPEYDDGLTKRMKDSARYVLTQRANGKTPDQHPADAFWS